MASNTRPLVAFLALGLLGCDPAPPDDGDFGDFRSYSTAKEVKDSFEVDFTPGPIFGAVGQKVTIFVLASFDLIPVQRYKIVWWLGAPGVVSAVEKFKVDEADDDPIESDTTTNGTRRVSWTNLMLDKDVALQGTCLTPGANVVNVAVGREHHALEGVHRAQVVVLCLPKRYFSVVYEHESSCALSGESTECADGTSLQSVELGCMSPTLREGGDPSVSADIECVDGLYVIGNFDGPSATEGRQLQLTVDAERTVGFSGTESAAIGGWIPPIEGQPLTLGTRIDAQVEAVDGELVYSDMVPPLATFSAAEEGPGEPVALWGSNGEPDPEAVPHYLYRLYK